MEVVVDEFSKSSSCDDSEECDEQLGDHLDANEEMIKVPTEMMAALRDLAKMENLLRGSGAHLGSGRRL